MGAVFIHQLKQKTLFNCCIVNLGKSGLCDSVLGITNTVKLSHTVSHTVNHTLSYTTHTYIYNTHTVYKYNIIFFFLINKINSKGKTPAKSQIKIFLMQTRWVYEKYDILSFPDEITKLKYIS